MTDPIAQISCVADISYDEAYQVVTGAAHKHPISTEDPAWAVLAILGWFLFAMQTWKKAITKEEVVATYERLSNEIEKEVIRMAEDLAKDPHNLFLLKTGYQHIVFNPDGVRARPSSPPPASSS